MSAGARIARAALIVAAFGILSRFLGLIREAVLLNYFGTTGLTDAYQNGLWVVNTCAAVLSYTLITLVIPVFQQEEHDHGERSAWRLLGAIISWVSIVLVAVTALAAIWPEAIAAPFQMDAGDEAALADLIRIMAPAIGLQGTATLFVALLQIRGRFTRPAAIGVMFNLGILIGVFALQSTLGIEAAAWGVTLGALMQISLQTPQFVRFWRAGGGRLGLRHPRLHATGMMALPVLAATLVQQANSFTDRLFIELWDLPGGAVQALVSASALGSAPRTALLFPLLVPLFPHVARLMVEGRYPEAQRAFLRASGLLAMVGVPTALVMAVEADGAAQLLFQRGACDLACRTRIDAPLVFYGIAIWGAFMVYMLNRTLSAAQRPRQIMICTIATVAIVIGFDVVLIGPLEQAGLALASMIGIYANVVMMTWFAQREIPDFSARAFLLQQARIGLCAVPAAAVLLVLGAVTPTAGHGWIATFGLLSAKAALAAAIFAGACALFARDELRDAVATLRSALKRRRKSE